MPTIFKLALGIDEEMARHKTKRLVAAVSGKVDRQAARCLGWDCSCSTYRMAVVLSLACCYSAL